MKYIDKANWDIVFIDGYYRFIDNANKLLTTGFKTEDKLIAYKMNFRTDNAALKIMQKRYNDLIKVN